MGLRDRAFLGVLVYSFARVAAHRLTGRLSVDLEGSESTLAIVTAAAPGQVLERTAADVSFLAGMLVDKSRYHLPLSPYGVNTQSPPASTAPRTTGPGRRRSTGHRDHSSVPEFTWCLIGIWRELTPPGSFFPYLGCTA